MKKVINTYQHTDGGIFPVEAGSEFDRWHSDKSEYTLIGTEEREFNLPKKMVTRVVYPHNIATNNKNDFIKSIELDATLPANAKNIRISYDIEETLPT